MYVYRSIYVYRRERRTSKSLADEAFFSCLISELSRLSFCCTCRPSARSFWRCTREWKGSGAQVVNRLSGASVALGGKWLRHRTPYSTLYAPPGQHTLLQPCCAVSACLGIAGQI